MNMQSGFTALHLAAHFGSENVARLLIDSGADVNFMAKVGTCIQTYTLCVSCPVTHIDTLAQLISDTQPRSLA